MTSTQKTWAWIVGIGIILVIIFYSSGQNKNTTQTTATTNQQPQGISMSQVEIKNLKLGCAFNEGVDGTGVFPSCGPAGFILKGEVTNNSSISFKDIYLTVDGYDCPGSTITPDCTHVAKTTWAELSVDDAGIGGDFSPGLTKAALAIAVDLSGMPPIQGNFLWSYQITPCPTNTTLLGQCGFWNGYDVLPALP